VAVSWRRGSLLMPSRKNKPPPDFLLSHKQHTLLNSPPFFPSLCFLLSLLTLGIDHFLFTKRDRRGGRWIALDCVGLRSIALDCVGLRGRGMEAVSVISRNNANSCGS